MLAEIKEKTPISGEKLNIERPRPRASRLARYYPSSKPGRCNHYVLAWEDNDGYLREKSQIKRWWS
jgi:hypothetical protein